jgi:tRNA modification GTPase
MYELSDTIVAVSSPTADNGVIIRLSGPETIEKMNELFSPHVRASHRHIVRGKLRLDDDSEFDATIYIFAAGRSYTGETLAEIHFRSNRALTEAVVEKFLAAGARLAGPGEFTARAYLNGRLDLAAAEAVNKVITSSNRLQLSAARKLLAGRLTDTTARAADEILQTLSLLEAGMDFSTEDIEFISADAAIARLKQTQHTLEQLLAGSITFEAVTDLPSVGIAGAVNAGKSSLLNKLLGRDRSIVSPQAKTTRDVLTGIVEMQQSRFVLFDCAGLIADLSGVALAKSEAHGEIDSLAQAAAVEALNNADLVIFCVDVTKRETKEDILVRSLIKPSTVLGVATKADLVDDALLQKKTSRLAEVFAMDFFPVSSLTGRGLDRLCDSIERKIAGEPDTHSPGVALTARHKRCVGDAVENLKQAADELSAGNDEVAAMLLRAAYQSLGSLEREHVDEKILDNLFSRFCIGK